MTLTPLEQFRLDVARREVRLLEAKEAGNCPGVIFEEQEDRSVSCELDWGHEGPHEGLVSVPAGPDTDDTVQAKMQWGGEEHGA